MQTLSEHPPIPPNCKWFFKETMQKGSYGFELFDRDYDDWWPLPEIDKLEKAQSWRKIVAAVARCAWLDEALKRDAGAEHKNAVKWDDGFSCNDCYVHADEWRKWGLKADEKRDD